MELNSSTARQYTDIVIDNFEGGYYHPDMKAFLKGGENMGDSGETMFGVDFKHGGSLGTSEFATEVHNFFAPYVAQVVDNASAVRIYNDKADGRKVAPKEYGQRWRQMTADMMLQLMRQNMQYLTPEAQQMVLNEPALFLQFWYACWNGSGNFQKFAEVMNRAYNDGVRDPQTINILILQERYKKPWNSTAKMDAITAEMYGKPNTMSPATTGGKSLLPWLLIGGAALLIFLKFKK